MPVSIDDLKIPALAHDLLCLALLSMPSDWPQVFFNNRPAILFPPPASIPPSPVVAKSISPANPVASASDKWPDLFFGQRVASTPRPEASREANPPAQRPFQTARIPVPRKEDTLPTVTLPKRIAVPISPGQTASAAPAAHPVSAAPTGIPSLKLTNGESVCGTVLSETPDAIFLQHEILGVITVPKNAIASRFVEILLHNGDTVAGEWIVDTAQFLLVRSPMLGTLTVPRQAIRSIG